MTAPTYPSPILDGIARRACAELVMAGPRGRTVREIAGGIGANPKTVGNVLRGASVTYGDRLFVRVGRRWRNGRPHRWTVRGLGR